MVIYLRHLDHGMKVAISDLEAMQDLESGWERFDPEEKIEQEVANEELESEISVNELKYKRRRKID